MSKTVRVVLVDGRAFLLAGLKLILESVPGIKVIGSTDRCNRAFEIVAAKKPDAVVLDPAITDTRFIGKLRSANQRMRIILLPPSDGKEHKIPRIAFPMKDRDGAGVLIKELLR